MKRAFGTSKKRNIRRKRKGDILSVQKAMKRAMLKASTRVMVAGISVLTESAVVLVREATAAGGGKGEIEKAAARASWRKGRYSWPLPIDFLSYLRNHYMTAFNSAWQLT